MISKKQADPIIKAIAKLKEEEAVALVQERLEAGDDALELIKKCQEGMRQVGERYERHEYFLAGLIMAGEIFRQIMKLLQPVVESESSTNIPAGKVLLGTVAGDIHDLGKNIVSMLLSCHQFIVYDLGVDIAPQEFAQKAREIQPDIIGLSGIITIAFDSMKETIALLRKDGCKAPIIIGGSQLDSGICEYTGADYWVTDAVVGVELCQSLVTNKNKL